MWLSNSIMNIERCLTGVFPQIIAGSHSQLMVECMLSTGVSLMALGPLYDEQVEWAKEMPWYSQLMLKSFNYSTLLGEQVDIFPAHAVLEVCWMLHQILQVPLDVVHRILDLSEYWIHSYVAREDHVEVGVWSDIVYLSAILNSKTQGSLRKIVFTTKSHPTSDYFGI